MKRALGSGASAEDCCIDLANQCDELIKGVGKDYDDNAEQMSRYLLVVFEFWISMDKKALEACPLLFKFHPILVPEILDILQFSSFKDLQRIRRAQQYLHQRVCACRLKQKSIVSRVEPGCFASRFVQGSKYLQQLMEQLEVDSETARGKKKQEWTQMCHRYDDLTELILERTCECAIDSFGKKIKPVCQKCSYWGGSIQPYDRST